MKMAQLSEINEIYFLNSEYDEQSGSVPGIDNSGDYCEIAKKRLETWKGQQRWFC